ncbi:hypothetical protein, partial [Leptospira levettii]|uniref:hypothetical protein n=1 Tax=Leptospira levettii TaxID=2023178 RepID=UPI000CA9051E
LSALDDKQIELAKPYADRIEDAKNPTELMDLLFPLLIEFVTETVEDMSEELSRDNNEVIVIRNKILSLNAKFNILKSQFELKTRIAINHQNNEVPIEMNPCQLAA